MQEKHLQETQELEDDNVLWFTENEDSSDEEISEEVDESQDEPEKDEVATSLFDVLKDKGLFSQDEEFDGTWEKLEEKFNELPDRITTSIVSQFPQPVQDLLEFALSKPKLKYEDLQEFFNSTKQEELNLDLSDNDDARKYLTQVYLAQGEDEEDIEDILDRLEDKGKLITKAQAEKAKADAQTTKQKEALVEQAKRERQAEEQKYEQIVQGINQELQTSKFSPEMKKQVLANLDSNTLASKNAKVMQSPKGLVQLAAFYATFDEKSGTFNLDVFRKQLLSKEVESQKKSALKDKFSSSPISKSKSVNDGMDANKKFVPIPD